MNDDLVQDTTAQDCKERIVLKNGRLFVGNLPKGCTEAQLHEDFGTWGTINDMVIIKSKFAFLTYSEMESAQKALGGDFAKQGYTVRPANDRPIPRVKQQKGNKQADTKNKLVQDLVSRLDKLSSEQVVLVQCNASHLLRLEHYIAEQESTLGFQVISSIPCGRRKGLSLLFLQSTCEDLTRQASLLANDEYLKPALNQVVLVSPKPHRWDVAADTLELKTTGFNKALDDLLPPQKFASTNKPGVSVRIQAFPPRLQGPLTDALEEQPRVKLSPTDYTHVFSLVQISDEGPYLMGLSDATSHFGHLNDKGGSHDDIPRAYFKLNEAFGRYKNNNILLKSLKDTVAMDCGAAPGGWTRFLMEQGHCKKVYSIDPGNLSPSVLDIAGVEHLKMTLGEAIPVLKGKMDEKTIPAIDVFVSDMCLHDMERQLDMLLEAKQLLKPNALFVLTLKCVAGHTKTSYDYQVNEALERFKDKNVAYGVKSIHLFANRNAERTFMGYLR